MKYLTEEDCYIKSDYLSPINHNHNVHHELILNVYKMLNARSHQFGLGYYTTLYGYCKSCNISLDSSSEARLSASITLILADDIKDDLLVKPEGLNWLDCAYQIIREYTMIDVETGEKEIKEVKYGFVFPNSCGFNYNADTRELSISGADIITALSDVRGGHLYDVTWGEEYLGEEYWRNAGLTLMGSAVDYVRDIRYINFYQGCKQEGKTDEQISALWKEGYKEYSDYQESQSSQHPQQTDIYNNVGMHTIYETVQDVWNSFTTGMMHHSPLVRLYGQEKHLPKDLEFDGTATVLDVYKAIVDLYPNQCIYFDNSGRLVLEELPSAHYDKFQDCRTFSKELMDIVVSENVNYNFENIVNYVIVYGKDGMCAGKYEVRTGWQCTNEGCQGVWNPNSKMFVKPIYEEHRTYCPACGSILDFVGEECELSTDRIGIHKKVINCDTYYTDEECKNAAKAECLMANKFSETISLTVTDTYLSIYEMYNLGVGRKIEYTPISTGETNVYTLDKLNVDAGSGEVNLELTRFYPIRDCEGERDILDFRQGNIAPLCEPLFEGYELSDTGLLTIYISNAGHGKFSLYKIYQEVNYTFDNGEYNYGVTTRNKFVGQTCEEMPEEERIAKGFNFPTKIFRMQLYKDGIYRFRAKAYNPNFEDSPYSSTWYKNPLRVEVKIFGNHLMVDGYNPLLLNNGNETGDYLYIT